MKAFVLLIGISLLPFLLCGQEDTIPQKKDISNYQIETARAHRNAANQFFEDELYYEAIEEYTKAIKSNPYDRIAWYNRSLSYARLEDKEKAIKDLSRILELEDGFVAGYFLRGTYSYELEDYRQAKKDFSSIISIRPRSALSYRKRGTVRFVMNDRNGALKDYNESIRLNPNDPVSFHDRAVVRDYLGDKKGAKDDRKMEKDLRD